MESENVRDAMTEVDPSDDSVIRWIAYHNKFDASRNEVRHVFIGAFSTESEFTTFVTQKSLELDLLKLSGDAKSYEFIGGNLKYPGADQNAKENRALVKQYRKSGN